MKSSGGKIRKAKGTGPKGAGPKAAPHRQQATKPRPQFAKPSTPADSDARVKPAPRSEPLPKRVLTRQTGARPAEKTRLILETLPSDDYALLDSGNGLKLEQYGPYQIIRPEGQAIWLPAWSKAEWDKADAIFTGNTDEEGVGRWHFPNVPLGETWPMAYDGIPFFGRFTSFRHVGVFPEQGTHWSHIDALIRSAKRPVKVLNLFGYTGVASLVAARAGAEVTHVDASKKAIV